VNGSDALGLEMGRGINSLFAFGGIGTLVFSLASKDIASQLVSGLVISTSDRFYEGESIHLGAFHEYGIMSMKAFIFNC
jgi:small-conductance mechanosensitive channel